MTSLMKSAHCHTRQSVKKSGRRALWLSKPQQLSLKYEGSYYGASNCLNIEQNGNDDLYLLRYLPECKCWVEKLWTELSRNIAKILGIDNSGNAADFVLLSSCV